MHMRSWECETAPCQRLKRMAATCSLRDLQRRRPLDKLLRLTKKRKKKKKIIRFDARWMRLRL